MAEGVKVSWIAGDLRQCEEKTHSLAWFSISNPWTLAHAMPPLLPLNEKQTTEKQLLVNKIQKLVSRKQRLQSPLTVFSGSLLFQTALTQLLQPSLGLEVLICLMCLGRKAVVFPQAGLPVCSHANK